MCGSKGPSEADQVAMNESARRAAEAEAKRLGDRASDREVPGERETRG